MRFRVLCLVVALAAGAGACDKAETTRGPTESGPGSLEMRQSILANSADIIHGTYVEASAEFEELDSALQGEDLSSMQAEFHDAMDVWQRAEAMIVGPAGSMGDVAGGEDLRDQIYSWPLANPCRVDQELVAQSYETAETLALEPVNARGLDALEYLLFNESTENACPANLSINADGDWAALSAEEIQTRRLAYARQIGGLLVQGIEVLESEWAESGTFRADFVNPADGETYRSTREVLNGLSDALFYLEKEVKDMKLAPAAGISDCLDNVCPDKRESQYANRSLANIRANVVGFGLIYRGGTPDDDGMGFDDLLEAVSQIELDMQIEDGLAALLEAIDTLDGTMAAELESNPDAVKNLHSLAKDVSLILKTEFVTVLDLDLPRRAEGDND